MKETTLNRCLPLALSLLCAGLVACSDGSDDKAATTSGAGGGTATSTSTDTSTDTSTETDTDTGGGGVGGNPATPCEVSADLDSFIETMMEQNQIPGLAAGIVSKDGMVWARGYGQADIAASRKVTKDTVFALMSISKVVTAAGVMQLVDAGSLDLDTDINSYLKDFQIVHPSFPNSTMTTRQLLTHTSGIAGDEYGVLQLNIATSDADVQPLGEMLASLLTPGGARYDNGYNFSDSAPGTAFAYSRIAISLAGFVAESVAQTGFDQLTDKNIFQSLGMTNTSWRLSPYQNKMDQVAVMYNYEEASSSFSVVEPFTFSDYPAGSIRSTVPDLSRFLAAMINKGSYSGQQILEPATVAAMGELQYPDFASSQAIGWTRWEVGERIFLGHGGDDSGASTDMRLDLTSSMGVILLMNTTRRPNTDAIVDRLFEESDGCK